MIQSKQLYLSTVAKAVTPPTPRTDSYVRYLPYIVLGSLAVVSAFAVLFLPETFGKDLPQTIQEMQKAKRWVC